MFLSQIITPTLPKSMKNKAGVMLINYTQSPIFNLFYHRTEISNASECTFLSQNNSIFQLELSELYYSLINLLFNNWKMFVDDNDCLNFDLQVWKKLINSYPGKTAIKQFSDKISVSLQDKDLQNFLFNLKVIVVTHALTYLIQEEFISPESFSYTPTQLNESINILKEHPYNTRRLAIDLEEDTNNHFVIGSNYIKDSLTLCRHRTDVLRIRADSEELSLPSFFEKKKNAFLLYKLIKNTIIHCIKEKPTVIKGKTLSALGTSTPLTRAYFNPFALYELIQYIEFLIKKDILEPHPDFNKFFDPCARYGERLIAAYLSVYFDTIYCNDINKHLANSYAQIVETIEQFIPYRKNIFYANQNALEAISELRNHIDFIFTSLPPYYKRKGLFTSRKEWIDQWMFPLIKTAILETLIPGGIAAFNIKNKYLKLILERLATDEEFKKYVPNDPILIPYGLSLTAHATTILLQRTNQISIPPNLEYNESFFFLDDSLDEFYAAVNLTPAEENNENTPLKRNAKEAELPPLTYPLQKNQISQNDPVSLLPDLTINNILSAWQTYSELNTFFTILFSNINKSMGTNLVGNIINDTTKEASILSRKNQFNVTSLFPATHKLFSQPSTPTYNSSERDNYQTIVQEDHNNEEGDEKYLPYNSSVFL